MPSQWMSWIVFAAIALTARSFSEYSRYAFWLVTPYLGWVGYATYLNFGLWRPNRRATGKIPGHGGIGLRRSAARRST